MFIEVMRYLHDNKWCGPEPIKRILRLTALLTKTKRAFLNILCYTVLFLWRKFHNLPIG